MGSTDNNENYRKEKKNIKTQSMKDFTHERFSTKRQIY
jgi:hypothetical protein